jgi:hypothetical protein
MPRNYHEPEGLKCYGSNLVGASRVFLCRLLALWGPRTVWSEAKARSARGLVSDTYRTHGQLNHVSPRDACNRMFYGCSENADTTDFAGCLRYHGSLEGRTPEVSGFPKVSHTGLVIR